MANKFRAVVQTASTDNMQVQAVLTLLILGSKIMAAPELYGNAIDALEGTQISSLTILKSAWASCHEEVQRF